MRRNSCSDWVEIPLGRRRVDTVLAVNMHEKSVVVKHRTAFIEGGVYLEEIEPGPDKSKTGMVLFKTNWNKLYFLRERPHWVNQEGRPNYEDYFKLADRLLWEKGITQP